MRARILPAAAPLYLFVLAYLVLWVLGLAYLAWPLAGLLFALPLALGERPVRVPPGFGLWMLFLLWMLLSSTQVDTSLRVALFGWRAVVYLAATAVFLWVFNQPRAVLTDRAVTGPVVLLWSACVLGGLAGVAWPSVAWHSLAESVLPRSIVHDPTGFAYVHPALVDTKFRALGHAIGRPKAFFAYTNQWGAAIGVMTPFAVAAFAAARGVKRTAIGVLLALSVVPIVVSLNRGLWLALAVALVYIAWRLAVRGNARLLLTLLGGTAVVAVIVLLSPLGSLLHQRLSSQTNSNGTRTAIYGQTVDQVRSSPVFGFGSPRPTTAQILTGAHVGTQGQIYLVLFSHGIPGLIFFVAFFGVTFVRSCRGRLSMSAAWNIALLIAGVEMFFYDFVPTTIVLIMIAAALAHRSALAGDYATAPVAVRRAVSGPAGVTW
jgi:polysaccharide biosynthesis protein PslJ